MERNLSRPLTVFFCYARKDRALCIELNKHLAGLSRSGFIRVWYDGDISPGTAWEQEIETHLHYAHIILLLISPDFLHSDYCYSNEMFYAIKRHQQKDARVIPVLLRPVDWTNTPFSSLQMLPSNTQPITTWPDRDVAFADVAKGIRQVVNELLFPNRVVTNPPVFPKPIEQHSQISLKAQAVRPQSTRQRLIRPLSVSYIRKYSLAHVTLLGFFFLSLSISFSFPSFLLHDPELLYLPFVLLYSWFLLLPISFIDWVASKKEAITLLPEAFILHPDCLSGTYTFRYDEINDIKIFPHQSGKVILQIELTNKYWAHKVDISNNFEDPTQLSQEILDAYRHFKNLY